MPDLDPFHQHERRQNRNDDSRESLAEEDEASRVEPVRESARHEVEDDCGDSLSRRDEAEGDFLAGDVVHQPSLSGEKRLLRRNARDEAQPVTAVIPAAKDDKELEASS